MPSLVWWPTLSRSINTIGIDGVLYFLGFKDSYFDETSTIMQQQRKTQNQDQYEKNHFTNYYSGTTCRYDSSTNRV